MNTDQQTKIAKGKEGGTPTFFVMLIPGNFKSNDFAKCGFQRVCRAFSQLRILKACERGGETEGGREAERHDVGSLVSAKLCWALHFMLPRWRLRSMGNWAATKKTRKTHSKGISGTVGVNWRAGRRSRMTVQGAAGSDHRRA